MSGEVRTNVKMDCLKTVGSSNRVISSSPVVDMVVDVNASYLQARKTNLNRWTPRHNDCDDDDYGHDDHDW